jgi:hypothetical protein
MLHVQTITEDNFTKYLEIIEILGKKILSHGSVKISVSDRSE